MALLKKILLSKFKFVITVAMVLTIAFGFCFYKNQTAAAFVPSFDSGYAVYPVDSPAGYEVWDDVNHQTFYPLTGVSAPTSTPIFDPDGNLYILDTDLETYFHLNCYSYKSHYSQSCLNPYIDIGSFFPDIGQPIIMSMDNQRNIWAGLWTDNTRIAKLSAATNYSFANIQLYEATGKVCSNSVDKNDYTACLAHSGTMVGGRSGDSFWAYMDYYGNVWVGIWYKAPDAPIMTCLDGANNFQYCQGSVFDNDYGAIYFTHLANSFVMDSQKNIYANDANTSHIIKILTSALGTQSYTKSTINISDARYGYTGADIIDSIVIDSNDYIWIAEKSTGYVDCYNPKTDSSCGEHYLGSSFDVFAINVDKNNDLRITNTVSNKIIILDSSSGYSQTEYSPASGAYVDFNNTTSFYMNNLCKYLGGCTLTDYSNINISATVDPVLNFDIVDYTDPTLSVSTCALGTLTPNTLASCNYRIGAGTNALSGFQIEVQDVSTPAGLRANSGVSQIANVTDGAVDSGEEYGFTISSKPAELTAASTFASEDTAVPATNTPFISSSVPYGYIKDSDNSDTSAIRHSVIITQTTPAGFYTQTIRYTVTGNF